MAQSETENKIIETARELAWAYHDAGRPEAAIKTLRNAIDVFPQSADLYGALGSIYCVLGRYNDVVVTVEEMVENGGKHTSSTLNSLGYAYRGLGQYQEAEGAYEESLRMAPQSITTRINLASLYYCDLNQPRQAIRLLREGIGINPHDTDLSDWLSTIYIDRGQHREAVATVESMVANGGEHAATTWNNLGYAYYALGRNQEAEEAYQKSLKMAPQNTAVRLNFVGFYCDFGQFYKAIELLQEGIEINPRDTDLSGRLSTIYINLGQYGNAVATFEKMVANGGKHTSSTLNSLGCAYYWGLGRYGEAEGAYLESAKMDPDSPYPYIGLARLEIDCSGEEGVDPSRAISLLKRAFDNARGEEADKAAHVSTLIDYVLSRVTNGTSLPSVEQIMGQWREPSPSLGMR